MSALVYSDNTLVDSDNTPVDSKYILVDYHHTLTLAPAPLLQFKHTRFLLVFAMTRQASLITSTWREGGEGTIIKESIVTASKQASKQASNQASKQASKQALKQAGKQASKQANKHAKRK